MIILNIAFIMSQLTKTRITNLKGKTHHRHTKSLGLLFYSNKHTEGMILSPDLKDLSLSVKIHQSSCVGSLFFQKRDDSSVDTRHKDQMISLHHYPYVIYVW